MASVPVGPCVHAGAIASLSLTQVCLPGPCPLEGRTGVVSCLAARDAYRQLPRKRAYRERARPTSVVPCTRALPSGNTVSVYGGYPKRNRSPLARTSPSGFNRCSKVTRSTFRLVSWICTESGLHRSAPGRHASRTRRSRPVAGPRRSPNDRRSTGRRRPRSGASSPVVR